MVGWLSWELERASSAPRMRRGKRDLPITGGTGKWRVVERQSEGGRSSADRRDNTTRWERRTPASSMRFANREGPG